MGDKPFGIRVAVQKGMLNRINNEHDIEDLAADVQDEIWTLADQMNMNDLEAAEESIVVLQSQLELIHDRIKTLRGD